MPFQPDPIGHRAIQRQGVPAPRFRVAALQNFIVAVQKQHANHQFVMVDQPVQFGNEGVDAEIACPDIDTDRQRTGRAAVAARLHQAGKQGQWQIINGFVAEVLQHLEGGRPARAGHSGHQNNGLFHRLPIHRTTPILDRIRIAAPQKNTHRSISPALALTASRIFAAADASNGAIRSNGMPRSRIVAVSNTGKRSISPDERSTTRQSNT